MDKNHPLVIALNNLTHDLKLFIELSLRESDASWEEWLVSRLIAFWTPHSSLEEFYA